MWWPDKNVLLYGFGVLASIAVFHIVVFAGWPYAELLDAVAVFNAERSWIQNLNYYSLSKGTYFFALAGYGALLILSLASLYLLNFRFSAFRPDTLINLVKKIVKVWKAIPRLEKIIFITTTLALFLVRIYFIRKVGVHIDESANYLWFLRKGLPGVIFYYPIPNNHILYSLLCLLFKQFIAEPFWVLKLPAFLLSFIGTGLFYLAFRAVFPFLIAYVATFGISFSFYALYFSVYGRGYFLLLICYFLAFAALLKLTQKNENGYWLVFLIATVAGFYTIPVFIYPFVPLFIFGVISFLKAGNKSGLVNFIIITIFAAIASLLLYLPVILVSGPHQLFGNMYVTQALTTEAFFSRLPVYLVYMQGALLGQETLGFWVWLTAFLVLCVVVLNRKRFNSFWAACGFKPDFLLLVFLSSLIPWFLIVVQKVYPPERVWLFKTVPDFLILAFCLQVVAVMVFKNKQRIVIVVCVVVLAIYGTYEVLKLNRSLTESSEKARSKAAQELNRIQKKAQGKILYPKSRFFLYQKTAAGATELHIDEGKRVTGKEYDIIILDHYDPDSLFFDRNKFPLVYKAWDLSVFVRK